MMKSVLYAICTLMVTLPVNLSQQTQHAKDHQEPSGAIRQKAIGKIPTLTEQGLGYPEYESLSDAHPLVEIPSQPRAWVLEVEVFGGLMGIVKEHIFITSEGNITVDNMDGYRKVGLPEAVTEMDRMIKRATPSKWKAANTQDRTPISGCQDCYRTKLTLYRREEDGSILGYRVHWDEATSSRLIIEVAEISREAARVARRVLQQ